MLKLVDSSN